jgi:hypothetical protein
MRALFGCLAVLLGAVSISLAARYGYKGADTEIDGVISAVVFGAIALCAFIFDAAAVRLWFMGHRIGAVAIGAISAAALVVTFTNSLGAIAGRADTTQAERARAKAEVAADRAELARIVQERTALGQFPPAIDETVTAARAAVTAAEQARVAECERRGPRCREREKEEEGKRDSLAAVLTNKVLTVRAAELDADAKAIRARISKAPPVQHANPLGASLEMLIGAGAAALTAWQQAIVAAVFELCLVGVMVIYELLGHAKQPAQQRIAPQEVKSLAPPARRKAGTKANGGVKNFFRDHVIPADGERIEIKTLMRDYRAWCARKNVTPLDVSALLDELEKLCRKLGIETKVGGDQRVYCLNVKVATDPAGIAVAVH